MTSAPQSNKKAVLVTGASTGIGEACALELDRLGWQVFAGVRNEEAARRLASQASSRLVPLMLDVTDQASIASAFKTITERLGDRGLAGVVNNAGFCAAGPLEALPIDDLRRQLDVNVVGQVAVTQAALPLLRREQGRIVMMGSISGRVAVPFLGAYAASKFALEAISDSLRVEVHRWGIQVSIVEPGCIQTPIWTKSKSLILTMADRLSPEMDKLYGEKIRASAEITERCDATAMPVSCVVRVVVHALTARRPKTRYVVGRSAKLTVAILPFLPDRLRDWIIYRHPSQAD